MPAGVVDRFERLAEVAGERVGGGDNVRPGLDLHGAVAAGGPYELADGPAGVAFDPAADRERGEDDGQVGFDRVPGPVVQWAGPAGRFWPSGSFSQRRVFSGALRANSEVSEFRWATRYDVRSMVSEAFAIRALDALSQATTLLFASTMAYT
jgi:hypothetical protein